MEQSTCSYNERIRVLGKHHEGACSRPAHQNGVCLVHIPKHDFERHAIEAFVDDLKEEANNARSLDLNYVIDWCGASFPRLELIGWVFPRTLRISAADFPHGLKLVNCVFEGKVEAARAKFVGEEGALVIQDCVFHEFADFAFANFCPSPVIERCTFLKGASFIGSNLLSPNFSETKFAGKIKFAMTTFAGICDFKLCEFSGSTDFFNLSSASNASFDFRNSVVSGQISLGSDSAERESLGFVSFEDAMIETNGSVSFQNISCEQVVFRACTLGDKALLRFYDISIDNGDFGYIVQINNASVTFANTALDNVNFLCTNIEKFNFLNVSWLNLKGRQALWSELNLRKILEGNADASMVEKFMTIKAYIELIEDNYRQLVRNYDSKRSFTLAQDFHIGEMEMQRVKIRFGSRRQSLLAALPAINDFSLYNLFSKYGTDYMHSLRLLAGILLFIPILFMFSGLKYHGDISNLSATGNVIEYSLLADANHKFPDPSEIAKDYVNSLSFVLAVATLQKDTMLTTNGLAGHFLRTFTILAVSGQAALVLLSIRRKFKRSSGGGSD